MFVLGQSIVLVTFIEGSACPYARPLHIFLPNLTLFSILAAYSHKEVIENFSEEGDRGHDHGCRWRLLL